MIIMSYIEEEVCTLGETKERILELLLDGS